MKFIRQSKITIEDVLKATTMSLFTLSAACAMIYTTSVPSASADIDPSLGYDLVSVGASVTVYAACTLGGTTTAPHDASIMNSVYKDNIGTTVLNTTCNDAGGYAVYAIGHTGDTYGNTVLTYTAPDGATTDPTYDIRTGTATSGSTSAWAMKLDATPGASTATIENGFDNYSAVPSDYTKVASLSTATSGTGASVSTTYATFVSSTQPSGTYTGKVKYTLVHPSTAPTPTFMQDVAKIKQLLVNEGDTMQAIDKRDGKKYWIAKLADGKIWMTQNLDLDLGAGTALTPANTDISANWTPANSTTTFTGTSVSGWNDDNDVPYSADPGDVYYYSSGTTSDDPWYSSLETCKATHPNCDMRNHVGNYYNWSAAVASNDTSSMTTRYDNAPDSICPAGWHLPIARDADDTAASREWNALLVAESVMTNPTGSGYATNGFNIIRESPLRLTRSGYIFIDSLTFASSNGYYWTSTINSGVSAYCLNFGNNTVAPSNNTSRDFGYSVRCVAE